MSEKEEKNVKKLLVAAIFNKDVDTIKTYVYEVPKVVVPFLACLAEIAFPESHAVNEFLFQPLVEHCIRCFQTELKEFAVTGRCTDNIEKLLITVAEEIVQETWDEKYRFIMHEAVIDCVMTSKQNSNADVISKVQRFLGGKQSICLKDLILNRNANEQNVFGDVDFLKKLFEYEEIVVKNPEDRQLQLDILSNISESSLVTSALETVGVTEEVVKYLIGRGAVVKLKDVWTCVESRNKLKTGDSKEHFIQYWESSQVKELSKIMLLLLKHLPENVDIDEANSNGDTVFQECFEIPGAWIISVQEIRSFIQRGADPFVHTPGSTLPVLDCSMDYRTSTDPCDCATLDIIELFASVRNKSRKIVQNLSIVRNFDVSHIESTIMDFLHPRCPRDNVNRYTDELADAAWSWLKRDDDGDPSSEDEQQHDHDVDNVHLWLEENWDALRN